MASKDGLLSRRATVLAAICAALLSSCGGCASQPPSRPMAADAEALPDPLPRGLRGDTGRPGQEVLPVDERIVLSDGLEDFRNEYAFAVMVTASVKTGETLKCTGALIHPRLVLTSGHCVCARRPSRPSADSARFIIDNSTCAEKAAVTTVLYQPQAGGTWSQPVITAATYSGKTRPHPHLKVLLDAQSSVISSDADLAVIVLEKTSEGLPVPVSLASTEVQPGEVILMAGYGLDATTDLIHGVRRSGQKKVLRVPESGGDEVPFEAYGGDYTSGSGDLCMRKEEHGVSLVGVSGRAPGATASMTRISLYRDWLADELHRAQSETSTEEGASTPVSPEHP